MSARQVAVYWDFENLHASLYEERYGADTYKRSAYHKQERLLNIPALMEYIFSLGDIVINRAYNNWQSFAAYRDDLLVYAIDLIQLYPKGSHAKNGADIRLALDALEDAHHNPHITHIVILGGDSDYIAVAQKLKKLGKFVIGISIRNSTNPYWTRSCNEFKFYEMLISKATKGDEKALPAPLILTSKAHNDLAAAKETLIKAVQRLMDEDDADEVLKAKVRPMMNRLDPEFDPGNYKFATFNAFLAACDDVIRSRKGEFDIMISLATRGNGISPVQKIESYETAGQRNDQLSAEVCAPDGSLQAQVIYLFAWSVKANLFADQNGVTLTDIGATIRLLDLSFDLQKYGYTKARGFKAIADDAAAQGIISINYDEATSMRIVRPSAQFNAYIEQTPTPDQFDRIQCKRMLTKLMLMLKSEELARMLTQASIILETYQSHNESLDAEHLLEHLCQALVDEQNKADKWGKILKNALRSQIFKAADGHPITDMGAASIAVIEPFDAALHNYLVMAQQEILSHFLQKIELDMLRDLML